MKQIFFLVRTMADFDFAEDVAEFLGIYKVSVSDHLPKDLDAYHMIVLWSIRKLLPEVSGRDNVIVFHSSDLPKGRGWSPIYHAIASGDPVFTVTGILPVGEADQGPVVVKARFPLLPEYTAPLLRRFDHRLCIILISKLLQRFPDGHMTGLPQVGEASWHPRRRPADNEIDIFSPLFSCFNHLRACEPQHPAFFVYQGIKYTIKVTPEVTPSFPSSIQYEFHDSP